MFGRGKAKEASKLDRDLAESRQRNADAVASFLNLCASLNGSAPAADQLARRTE